MNLRGVLFLLGRILIAVGAALLIPAAVSYFTGGPDLTAFLIAAGVVGLSGFVLERWFRQPRDFKFARREAFVLVTAAWVTASLAGALPFVLYKGPGFIVDAIFEATSGFTTTGASILTDIEAEPHGFLLWRSLTQWMGGMGIIVLGIAILPKLAVGGMELLSAEAPGPIKEKLTPRIAQTAKALWGIYAAFTAAEAVILMMLGMTPLEAVNHAFATMATGGFSTRNASIGSFDSAAIDLVVTFFMLMAGVNFALHFQMIRGRSATLFKDPEFRLFIGIVGLATALLAVNVLAWGDGPGMLGGLQHALFQAASIVTTTGFATQDFDLWPQFSRVLLFLLMFVGGCAGSTGGSVKVVRVAIVIKKLTTDLRRLVRPHAVLPVRLGTRPIPDEVVASVTTFLLLFSGLFAVGGMLLAAMGLDPVSAFSASAACLGNIGPGLGDVGPAQNYAPLPDLAKLVLAGMMIVGRLEIYTVLVLFFLPRYR